MYALIKKIIIKVKSLVGIKISYIEYWKSRAINLGERSDINVGYDIDVSEVTKYQVEKIFPIFKKQLNGDEKIILDYGCGTGRFTSLLAKTINGKAFGVDVVKMLVDILPLVMINKINIWSLIMVKYPLRIKVLI